MRVGAMRVAEPFLLAACLYANETPTLQVHHHDYRSLNQTTSANVITVDVHASCSRCDH